MALYDLVIRSQLVPPRQRRGVLRRRRMEARLEHVLDYPLTLVQAGTGYGKSTALAALSSMVDPLFWYTVTEPDRDPLLFAAHMVCAFECLEPGWCHPVLDTLEEAGGQVTPALLTPLLNRLTRQLDGDAVLVLDDYHLVADVAEIQALVERLVDYIPPNLHVVISTRQMPHVAALTRWRAKGLVLNLGRRDLAFTAAEIEALFGEGYGYPLSPEQAAALASETEGWIIALQMVWQSLQSGAVDDLDGILGRLPATLDTLFDYLASDVLDRQAPPVQRFLLHTSVLRQMDADTCDYLLTREDSAAKLHQLQEEGLFVVSVGDDVYRYHRLFHDFLRARLGDDTAWRLHRRAAGYFRDRGLPDEGVYHLLAARDHEQAARLVEEIGADFVRLGRFDSLESWIARIDPAVRAGRPRLYLLYGDVLRLRARFEAALEHYAAADRLYEEQGDLLGRGRALQGQAQVYLDTVRPLKADSLLEEALRLIDPGEHSGEAATLLDSLAENKLNLGYPDQARALHHEARLLRADVDGGSFYLEARAMVRTGRLADARRLLEERAEEEQQRVPQRPQRFHRETLLLLSLVHALQGNGAAAARHAREGIATGRRLESLFVEAVGYMRLGHALQLTQFREWDLAATPAPARSPGSTASVDGLAVRPGGLRHAADYYERAIRQVRAFKVMRTQAEPLWGLCRAAAYSGDLALAESYARRGLETLRRAGDEWVQDLIQVTLGAAYAMAGRSEPARAHLSAAADSFGRVGDPVGQAAAWLWLALDAWWQGEAERAMDYMAQLLPAVRRHRCDYLLLRPTLLGLGDEQAGLPLLLEARRRGIEPRLAARLLEQAGVAGVDYHPGYSLTVRTLGPFAVWRGRERVATREWRREKARQIFQFLLTHRGQWFYREQIIEQLWPHLPPDAAERDFKVALSALNRALEPARPHGASPFFVSRRGDGAVYGLNPAAGLIVDVGDFERLAASDEVESLRRALALYEDDYLPDSLYEDWPAAETQRLRNLYLLSAEKLARHLLRAATEQDGEARAEDRQGALDEAIAICQEILGRDSCWEAAYRLLMEIYAAQGSRQAIHDVYARCVSTLRQELDVSPAPETHALFEALS
jgi:DNA-binding SARP family transcriptional activator